MNSDCHFVEGVLPAVGRAHGVEVQRELGYSYLPPPSFFTPDLLTLEPPPKPDVWVDVDGVMGDFVGAVCDLWYEKTGIRVRPTDLPMWSIFDSGALDRDLLEPSIASPGFCANIRPFPEAQVALKKMATMANVYACTSPWTESPYWVPERTAWLERHYGLDYHKQVHTHAKHLVKAKVIVDDRPSNVASWKEAFPDGTALLWDTPHNRAETAGIRVYSWNEVMVHVCAARWGSSGGELN